MTRREDQRSTSKACKPEEGPPINRQYPKDVTDLFAGRAVGDRRPLQESTATAKVMITGKIGDKEQKFDFPAKLVEKSTDESNAFVEKLWAIRRVGEILDEMDLKGQNNELIKELVALSTKHGILTPYTSFLADDTGAGARDLAKATLEATRGLERLEQAADGREGFALRRSKGNLQLAEQAPGAALPSARTRGGASGVADGLAAGGEAKTPAGPSNRTEPTTSTGMTRKSSSKA